MRKYTISNKTWKCKPCSEERMDSLIAQYKFCSVFHHIKNVKKYVNGWKKDFLITKNFKHYNEYDVWFK
jgi:hypothetical protein